MRAVVVLPTYNEADNIVEVLTAVAAGAPGVGVLVVDDHSPDGTAALAGEVAARRPGVDVHVRPARVGLGSAYRDGFARALASGHDVVVSMDADLSHDPGVISTMLGRLAEGADVVVGSRYVAGGGTSGWPLHRRLLSKWGNVYTRLALGLDTRDCTSGFRAYRAGALAAIDPASTSAEGYAFLTELAWRVDRAGLRVVEVPIVFRDRTRGTSKMSTRIVVESMALVTAWAVRDRLGRVRSTLRRPTG